MKNPTISIITANYNTAGNLFELYLNLLQQDSFDFEWIIVDSLSSDGSTDFVKNINSLRYKLISEKDFGIYDAFNKGVSLASGDLIYFLGADDRLASPSTLSSVIKIFNLTPVANIYYGSIVYDNLGRTIFKSKLNYKILFINSVHGQSVFYSKIIFKSFRFDITEKIIADYELNLCLYLLNVKKETLPFVIAVCGADGLSNTSNEYVNYRGMNKIRKKYINYFFSYMFHAAALFNLFFKKIYRKYIY